MSDDLVERLARAVRVALAANQGVEADVNSPMTPNEKRAYLPVARACLAELSAAGYAVVPVEPTEEMSERGGYWWYATLHNSKGQKENGDIIWAAMLAAWKKEST